MAVPDALVIGGGPNGLAAAITLARAGRQVVVYEARGTVGGGTRSAELTLPGFTHDICSAIHPLGVGSPFMRSLPLADLGVEWLESPAALAHPFDDGSAALLFRSIDATCSTLGADGSAYRRLMTPLAREWERVAPVILGPLRPTPQTLFPLAAFGLRALMPARMLARGIFRGERARALLGGMAAHGMLPLSAPASASFGLVLATLGHTVGWPLPRGGSQHIADALAAYLRSLGGEIVTNAEVRSLADLPPARVVLCDVTPRQLVALAGDRLPPSYRRALGRYRYGPGAFKIDYALDGPIPWRAAECAQAATVHLGGTLDEIEASEAAVARGAIPDRPFVLLAQPSLFDTTRAPAGHHTAWVYCHVPNGATEDMTARIEAQIERFAPGFGELVLARHVMTPADLAAYNPNDIGGDINGGAQDLRQLFTRPTLSLNPYATPAPGLYLCSSSTPPGGGVHGMCGYHAARAALRAWDR